MINNKVTLVGITAPKVEGVSSPEQFVAYCARVSNPTNQNNALTGSKLLKYLVQNKHWSPFEMVSIVLEIKTTRDIGRQILRHRSFSFQEFSQRYAKVSQEVVIREARAQDPKNRQNSIPFKDKEVNNQWKDMQAEVADFAYHAYEEALAMGVAKEQARALLPEGLVPTTMYMQGTLRSWIHYCDLRMTHGTQLEHSDIAKKAWEIIVREIPALINLLDNENNA